MTDDLIFVRYVPASNSWVSVEGSWLRRFHLPPPHTLNVPPGDTFLVCIILDEKGAVANLIPHRYEIDEHGGVHNMRVDALTSDEYDEMRHLMTESKTEADTKRYNELGRRSVEPCYPGPKAMRSLIASYLPGPITADRTCGIHREIRELKELETLQ